MLPDASGVGWPWYTLLYDRSLCAPPAPATCPKEGLLELPAEVASPPPVNEYAGGRTIQQPAACQAGKKADRLERDSLFQDLRDLHIPPLSLRSKLRWSATSIT